MSRQYWVAPKGPLHIASGTALANSTTLSNISPLGNIQTAVNELEAGTAIRIRAAGKFSTTGTPTLLLGFYYGGVAGVALAASSAITTGSGAASWPWILEYQGRVRSITATGTIMGMGELKLGTALNAWTSRPIPETEAARLATIDTTAVKDWTVGAQWGTANAANTITCDEILLEVLS